MNPWVAFAVGFVGMVLGIINTARALWHDSVRLRVRIIPTIHEASGDLVGAGVVVVNLSCFEVTIQQIDIPTIGGQDYFIPPEVRQQFGKRIAPRASCAVIFPARTLENPAIPEKFRFRVGTACGVKKYSPWVYRSKLNSAVASEGKPSVEQAV